MKKRWWILAIILTLGVAGFFTYRALAAGKSASTSNVQTATVKLGTITVTISGSGTVRSAQNSTVNWQTSGKVGLVSVQLGDHVQADEVLATLDPTSLPTSIIQAQSDLIDAQTTLEDLKTIDPLKLAQAQTDLQNAKTALDTLKNPSQTAIAQAQTAVINAQSAVDDAQLAVDKLQYRRASDQQLAAAKASYLLAQDKVDRLQQIFSSTPGSSDRDAGKALALSNLDAAEYARNKALAVLNWYQGKPTQSEIDQKTTALSLAKGQLADAQAALDKLTHPTAEDIALAQATVDNAQKALDDLKAGPTADQLTAAQTKVTLAQAALNEAKLTAPFAGVVTDIEVEPGDIISAGKTAFRIDDLSKLYVDLQVSEIDVLSIKQGQDVTLTFDAISDKEYHGKVTEIGLVGSVSQGVVNYPVTVQITDGDSSILSGMTAAVNIVTAEHQNVLVVPNQAIHSAGTSRTVTVLVQGQQIQVPVTIGLVGDTTSEVTGNTLKEGDTLVINNTTSTSSTTTTRSGVRFQSGGDFGGGPFGP